MHARDDLNCTRGYEFWLMKEAKKRNPGLRTWGLAWGEFATVVAGCRHPSGSARPAACSTLARVERGVPSDWTSRAETLPALRRVRVRALPPAGHHSAEKNL